MYTLPDFVKPTLDNYKKKSEMETGVFEASQMELNSQQLYPTEVDLWGTTLNAAANFLGDKVKESEARTAEFLENIPGQDYEPELVPAALRPKLTEALREDKMKWIEASKTASLQMLGSKKYMESVELMNEIETSMNNKYNGLLAVQNAAKFEGDNFNTRIYKGDEDQFLFADRLIQGVNADDVEFGPDGTVMINDGKGQMIDMSQYKTTAKSNVGGLNILNGLIGDNAYNKGVKSVSKKHFIKQLDVGLVDNIKKNADFADELFYNGVDSDKDATTALINFVNISNEDDDPNNDLVWDGLAPSQSQNTMNTMLAFYRDMGIRSYDDGLNTSRATKNPKTSPNLAVESAVVQVQKNQPIINLSNVKGNYGIAARLVDGKYYIGPVARMSGPVSQEDLAGLQSFTPLEMIGYISNTAPQEEDY